MVRLPCGRVLSSFNLMAGPPSWLTCAALQHRFSVRDLGGLRPSLFLPGDTSSTGARACGEWARPTGSPQLRGACTQSVPSSTESRLVCSKFYGVEHNEINDLTSFVPMFQVFLGMRGLAWKNWAAKRAQRGASSFNEKHSARSYTLKILEHWNNTKFSLSFFLIKNNNK